MIELFSILPEYPLKKDGREIPLHFDQDASLSALLLDEDYYNILVHEKETIQGYSVLSNCGLYSSKISSNHVSFALPYVWLLTSTVHHNLKKCFDSLRS
ncbi:Uncharacterised protein [Streptococcus pneumoniae]|nr:Uncharacterised protein [Streptococcus pneumoniae]